jgi:hypothetical protein
MAVDGSQPSIRERRMQTVDTDASVKETCARALILSMQTASSG